MEEVERSIIVSLNNVFGVGLKESSSLDELRERLSGQLNALITKDFNRLISLLYRLDIDESRARETLHNNPGIDAGTILADLVIERQIRKLESRAQSRKNTGDEIDENEKW